VIPQPDVVVTNSRRGLRDGARRDQRQIGRTRLSIRAVLELGVGQVIELDRQVGAPIDIIANKRP